MGSWLRFHEYMTERSLRRGSSRGIRSATVGEAIGHGNNANGNSRAAQLLTVTDEADDVRRRVPPNGLKEYWYPALPEGKVGRKPVFWVMLGKELVFFRDASGQVACLSDVCPHRGAALSQGACYFPGFISCPYHGATFDGAGNCVAWITEGPDSKMVGNIQVPSLPTKVLKGWVFVWMGDTEPAPIEEDVPPEFLEEDQDVAVNSSYTYWKTNWLIAIENMNDSHNCDFVHRNSIKQFTGLLPGRKRTPIGPRTVRVNGRAVVPKGTNQDYYSKDGVSPHQLYYPGVGGSWPKSTRRLLWQPHFRKLGAKIRAHKFATPEEWSGGHHLPSIIRVNYGRHMYTRYAVPVEENLSRIVIFHTRRLPDGLSRLKDRFAFRLFWNYVQNYNFSGQDNRAASPVRYWTKEVLSPTDSHLVLLRDLITEGSRDVIRAGAPGATEPLEPTESLEPPESLEPARSSEK